MGESDLWVVQYHHADVLDGDGGLLSGLIPTAFQPNKQSVRLIMATILF